MPSEGEGIALVRNQAFRVLSDLLDLPGGIDALQHVDLDRATPVVPLDRVMQAGLAVRFDFRRLEAGPSTGGGTWDWGASGLSPWESTSGAAWTFQASNPGGLSWVPENFEAWVAGVRATSQAGATVEDAALFSQGSIGGGTYQLARFNSSTIAGHLGNVSPVPVQFPYKLDKRIWPQVRMAYQDAGAGVADPLAWSIDVIAAPPGIIPLIFG